MNLYAKITHLGVASTNESVKNDTIVLTNQIAVIMSVAALPYFFIFHYFHYKVADQRLGRNSSRFWKKEINLC